MFHMLLMESKSWLSILNFVTIPREKYYLLTSSLPYTLVSKHIFQVKYLIICQILKINYIKFGDNNVAKFIDYQILAYTLILNTILFSDIP